MVARTGRTQVSRRRRPACRRPGVGRGEPAGREHHARSRDGALTEPRTWPGAVTRSTRRRARSPECARHDFHGVRTAMTITTFLNDDGVLTLTLDRVAARNAIDDEMMRALIAAFEGAATDDRVRVILLQGAGDHFCSGADVVARNAGTDVKPRVGSIQRRVPGLAHRLIPLVLRVQVPVVCKVRGWAAGIGLQLALAA